MSILSDDIMISDNAAIKKSKHVCFVVLSRESAMISAVINIIVKEVVRESVRIDMQKCAIRGFKVTDMAIMNDNDFALLFLSKMVVQK